jgi:predicted mannosyl-3-phosphoglycerate phosphatase (HAD superfamily)
MMLGPRSGGSNFRRFFIFPLSSIPLQSNCTSLDAFDSLRLVICASQPAPRSFLLRSPNLVVYCAIDSLISPSAQPAPGFDDFLAALTEATIPCVWVTRRNRHQLDAAIRMLGQGVPFIAESGSGVYLPEGYFNLRPERIVRFARFTCIPVAAPLPAAAHALELLAEETHIEVVPLRSLSPRELSQNTGLRQRDAELLRQRDFEEYFFFAGASDAEIKTFAGEAKRRNLQLRARENLWSIVPGSNIATCVRELNKLYDRAMKGTAYRVAVASAATDTSDNDAAELFPACNRSILLTKSTALSDSPLPKHNLAVPYSSPDAWEAVLEAVQAKRT